MYLENLLHNLYVFLSDIEIRCILNYCLHGHSLVCKLNVKNLLNLFLFMSDKFGN